VAGKIFIVEDDKKDIAFLQKSLEKEKYTVIQASNGKDAF
jgi:DNA-binding response OmpR family regulator